MAVPSVSRLTVVWSGLVGMPGYSNFYYKNPIGASARLGAYLGAIRNFFPTGLTWTIPAEGDVFDAGSGTLTGFWSESGGGPLTATGAPLHAAPVGAVVNWLTEGINRGHKIRGRTFLVPLSANAFQDDGSILDTTLGSLRIAAATLISDGAAEQVVWSRPVAGAGGAIADITDTRVPDLAAVLRSRRD